MSCLHSTKGSQRFKSEVFYDHFPCLNNVPFSKPWSLFLYSGGRPNGVLSYTRTDMPSFRYKIFLSSAHTANRHTLIRETVGGLISRWTFSIRFSSNKFNNMYKGTSTFRVRRWKKETVWKDPRDGTIAVESVVPLSKKKTSKRLPVGPCRQESEDNNDNEP